ncbi:MAG TPA: DUF1365 domain-containing protein, partial [Steroidobacteraceae bacterium]|nr:DUF1365 domain-containing protein [Steroidobacteraceae bacterium]
TGPIRMLTHLRYFGIGFNPVTFYYCFDDADTRVETVVAEITNTPWNERFAYVLDQSRNEGCARQLRYRFQKRFHVSPFIGMDVDYDWRLSVPAERLAVHMEDHEHGLRIFDATLTLERRDIGPAVLARALLAFPLMTAQVVAAIYWQALRLWLKRVPFFTHPKKLTQPGDADSATTS